MPGYFGKDAPRRCHHEVIRVCLDGSVRPLRKLFRCCSMTWWGVLLGKDTTDGAIADNPGSEVSDI